MPQSLQQLYRKFWTEAEARDLDEYVSIFHRIVMVDVVLVLLYPFIALQGVLKLKAGDRGMLAMEGVEDCMLYVVFFVLVLWTLDAFLLMLFINKVTKVLGKPDWYAVVTRWRKRCGGLSCLGLALCIVCFALEAYELAMRKGPVQLGATVIMLCSIFICKLIRVIALRCFGRWTKAFWQNQLQCALENEAAQQRGSASLHSHNTTPLALHVLEDHD
eukprot:TRINITY_DN27906_c0_g1_i1.p1 TRINITY_DN27906_c0_g1~~TRINITY_DN27906_c0_g1_i1.p1  ORF type:complete len:217 (+),score=38.75 TRINITY_DN27906_c0_g1_i1:69-719(+)